jgi:YVTN family beta-propeller protein
MGGEMNVRQWYEGGLPRGLVTLLLVGMLAGCSLGARAAQQSPFRVIRDVPVSGGTSRFDYQSLDQPAHRLYIAHLGAGLVSVFDTESGAMVGDVANVPGAHGVLAVPELGRVYASATDANQVAVIDPDSLSVVATVPGGDYPDGLAFAPEVGKLYVSDEHGKTDTVIDVQTNQVVSTIPLRGEAGNTQYDRGSRQIIVAVHSGHLVVIDPTTDTVVDRYEVPGCSEPHGLAIDADRRIAFVACQGNAKLAVVDLSTMTESALFGVGNGPDVLAYDPSLGQLYVAAESGPLVVFQVDDSGVRELARDTVGPNAHSVAVDPATHHIFLPLANVGGQAVLRELVLETTSGG